MKIKIISWNVNGIRAVERKGALDEMVARLKPDVICVQETKIGGTSQAETVEIEGYVSRYEMGVRAGYAGTAIFVREELAKELGITDNVGRIKGASLNIFPDALADKYGDPDDEGRVCMVEFPKFYLVSVYTPNSKDDLSRLKLREKYWDPCFLKKMKELEAHKPVIFCGDLNAAHEEIDIARPEANHTNAGFTDEERRGVTNICEAGFLDSFRSLNPEVVKYSWWSYRGNARARNVGWRIDYVFLSAEMSGALLSAEIFDEIMGSDHCPIGVEIEV